MRIIVCVKQVVDPEEPPSSFSVDEDENIIVLPPGVPSVISPFDRYAVEAALRIKDETGATVTALSIGADLDRNVVRDPVAMGADELVLVEDDTLSDGDSWTTAYVLSRAILKIGSFDLILCGRQASDWDNGQVGTGIAEILGLPCLTVAQKIEIEGKGAIVERVIDEGYEIIQTALPAVVTVSNEIGEPRYPTIKQVMVSKRKQPTVWKIEDLDLDRSKTGGNGRRSRLRRLYRPIKENRCALVTGESPEDAGANLALKLRDANLI